MTLRALPADLKPLAPYLQRAEETKAQNPIIAYWCTYYALQIGLSLKFEKRDPQRTEYLGDLMDSLEKEKARLIAEDGSDALTNADASCAFIDNFALKVFASADNEERKGDATRTTAKKFLAAANFFELLKIFDRLDPEGEEKVRYAKWRAADIAKAYREGRKPSPVPEGKEKASSGSPPSVQGKLSSLDTVAPSTLELPSPKAPATDEFSAPPIQPSTPETLNTIPPNWILPKGTPVNPGLWSNTATPGFVEDQTPVRRPHLQNKQSGHSEDDDTWSHAADIGSRQNSYTGHLNPDETNATEDSLHYDNVFAGGPESPLGVAMDEHFELKGNTLDAPFSKRVRWTPSVVGGSSTTGSPPISPNEMRPSLPPLPEHYQEDRDDPPHNPPQQVEGSDPRNTEFRMSHPNLGDNATSTMPSVTPQFPTSSGRHSGQGASGPALPSPSLELTHALVSKIQKHCRFAISSLDYEDVEQARQELRTALALLGGYGTSAISFVSVALPSFTTSAAPSASYLLSSEGDGALSAQSNAPVCIGHGIDNQAIGVIATFILSNVAGLLIWLTFAFLRPKFRQVYGLREWFVRLESRPNPLSDRFWAFLFPHVEFVPSLTTSTRGGSSRVAEMFSSDQELTQRILWVAFRVCLGLSLFGLAGALPLYLAATPCLAITSIPSRFVGRLSTLQDLSLLRLLVLLDNRDAAVPGDLSGREIVGGHDLGPNTKTRLAILTALVIAVGVIPAEWQLLREFNQLVAYRQRWLQVKCGSLDMGWLSVGKAPGFRGWGEGSLKDFFTKTGLSSMPFSRGGIPGPSQREGRMHPLEQSGMDVDIIGLFTINDTSRLSHLIDEREVVLNRLEEAETRYIASFRVTTPDPSVMEVDQRIPYAVDQPGDTTKPQISHPKVFSGSAGGTRGRRRMQIAADSSAPTSYVAPSSYYRLRGVKGINAGDMFSEARSAAFGNTVHERVVGTRFQELNRDSGVYGRIPLGSSVRVGISGDLEPIPDSTVHGPVDNSLLEEEISDEVLRTEVSMLPGVERRTSRDTGDTGANNHTRFPKQPGLATHQQHNTTYSSDRETFAMRETLRDLNSAPPPHLRVQPQQPFVRPLSGIGHDDLSIIYDDIRHWRSLLKEINFRLADAQQEGYSNIADGVNIKGWLLIGRGLRFLPGIDIIEGRSKSDIRWSELQRGESSGSTLSFGIATAFVAILLGAALVGVVGLALSDAPDVSFFLTFLQPLAKMNSIGAAISITLVPALLVTLFIALSIVAVAYAGQFAGSVSVSANQLTTFKAIVFFLVLVSVAWLVGVGSVIFALEAFDSSKNRVKTVAQGTLYMAAFVLALVINAAATIPALLVLRPWRLWKIFRTERRSVTPRQRFRAIYPRRYEPTVIVGCSALALAFAAVFSTVFPLIGPAIALLLFLTLVAHRYLVGYVYARTGSGQTGGLHQLWLLQRFGSIAALQPTLLGLILLAHRQWTLGSILLGCSLLVLTGVELYTNWRMRRPSLRSLSPTIRQSLATFREVAISGGNGTLKGKYRNETDIGGEENSSLVNSGRGVRSRGSMASVLEMMSITLAVMPSHYKSQWPVPLETDDLDDMIATERAARTHPDAPPHLPPLPFADHAEEIANILYAPELLAPPPMVWLPNDTSGIAMSEAYDLQRYHDLPAVVDVHSQEHSPLLSTGRARV